MSQYTPEQIDLRNLIYADLQFDHRGETDLKLEELQALVARGWMCEGADNDEFDITDEGRAVHAVALRQHGQPEDDRLHSDSAEDVAQWLYANGHHDAAATVRNQLDVRNVRIRELGMGRARLHELVTAWRRREADCDEVSGEYYAGQAHAYDVAAGELGEALTAAPSAESGT